MNRKEWPLFTMGAGVVLATVAAVVVATGNGNRGNGAMLVAFILTTLPALFFSERTAKDVRNGVIVEKSRQGAHMALEETGVTEAVAEGKETTPAALRALTALLAETEAGRIRRTALSDLLPTDDR